jgi:hypothetical protein
VCRDCSKISDETNQQPQQLQQRVHRLSSFPQAGLSQGSRTIRLKRTSQKFDSRLDVRSPHIIHISNVQHKQAYANPRQVVTSSSSEPELAKCLQPVYRVTRYSFIFQFECSSSSISATRCRGSSPSTVLRQPYSTVSGLPATSNCSRCTPPSRNCSPRKYRTIKSGSRRIRSGLRRSRLN